MAKKNYIKFIKLNEFFKNHIKYLKVYEKFLQHTMMSPEDRNKIVFIETTDKKYFDCKINTFLINMIFWRIPIFYNIKLDSKYMFDIKAENMLNDIDKIFDFYVEEFIKLGSKDNNKQFLKLCGQVIENLARISDLNKMLGCTLSLYDIINFKSRNRDFNNIINYTIPKNMSISDIEKVTFEKKTDFLDIVKNDKHNNLLDYIKSGVVNFTQFIQMLVIVGNKHDPNKVIIDVPISKSYLHGLNSASEIAVAAVSTLNNMLLKVDDLPTSGDLSKKVSFSCMDTFINYDLEDCKTKNFLRIKVKNSTYLSFFIDKFYFTDDNPELRVVKKDDLDLIGKTIIIRSFISCCSPTIKGICKTCYGNNAERIIGTIIGGLSTVRICNAITNKTMNAKRVNISSSMEINNEILLEHFDINSNIITLKEKYLDKLAIIVPYSRVIDLLNNNMKKDNIDSSINTSVNLENFIIYNFQTRELNYVDNPGIYFNLSNDILLHKNRLSIVEEKDIIVINLKNFGIMNKILNIVTTTDELSLFMKKFISMINGTLLKKYINYHDLIIDLIELMSNIEIKNIKLTELETIIYNMVKDVSTNLRRPNFKLLNVPYNLVTLDTSIIERDTIGPGFSTGYHKKQLKNPNIYESKLGHSIFDQFILGKR